MEGRYAVEAWIKAWQNLIHKFSSFMDIYYTDSFPLPTFYMWYSYYIVIML